MTDERDEVPYRPGMTLMPGQSTRVPIPLSPEVSEALGGLDSFRLVPAPPPREVPVQEEARSLGLIDGLRVDTSHGSYRCARCSRFDSHGGKLVWVPDGVRSSDSAEAVREQCRLSAYNGHGSGWCLACAKKLGRKRTGLWAWLLGRS